MIVVCSLVSLRPSWRVMLDLKVEKLCMACITAQSWMLYHIFYMHKVPMHTGYSDQCFHCTHLRVYSMLSNKSYHIILSTNCHDQLAHEPHFLVAITPHVFSEAKGYLSKINYKGFCALACDDTNLLPLLWPYYDPEQKSWMIVGNGGNPIIVANEDELMQVLDCNDIIQANKVRYFQMTASSVQIIVT